MAGLDDGWGGMGLDKNGMDGKPMEPGHIVICADDFGMHPAVNQAVLELGRLGRLNATSCLVDGPAFADDAGALRQLRQQGGLLAAGLQIGLHLNFTETFAQGTGAALPATPLPKLMRLAWLRRLDIGLLRREVARQFDRFEAIMQCAPDFVDGHQHVHQFPQIRDALLFEMQRRYPDRSALWLRSTRCHDRPKTLHATAQTTSIALKHRAKALVIERLGARALRRKMAGRWRMSRALAGVYDFQGGQAVYAGLLAYWLAAMQTGDVLMCHPASHIMPHDPLGAQRLAEYRALADAPIHLIPDS